MTLETIALALLLAFQHHHDVDQKGDKVMGFPQGKTTHHKLRKAEIAYQSEDLPKGGRVRIVTKNQAALKAVHEFLRFQISDHRTGDSGKIE